MVGVGSNTPVIGPVIHARAPCHFALTLAGGVSANAGECEFLIARPQRGHGFRGWWRHSRNVEEKYRNSSQLHLVSPSELVNYLCSMRHCTFGYRIHKSVSAAR